MTHAVSPPDISRYRAGNAGVEFVTSFDSGRPGTHAMITAVVHGNEPCGAVALDYLLGIGLRPGAGRLTLAFANAEAYARFDPSRPSQTRFLDEDLNRLWSPEVLDGPGRSRELVRARALRPILDEADMLLDIHSMHQGAEPLLLAGPLEKGLRLAQAVGFPGTIIRDAGHAGGQRLRDYGAFGDPTSPRAALLVECGQHGDPRSAAVAIDSCLRFLLHLKMIDRATAARHLRMDRPARQRLIEVTEAVTVRSERFRFAAHYRCMEVIAKAGTPIAEDAGGPVLTPYDDCVLVMPSLSPLPGQTAVRLGRLLDPTP